MRGGWAIKREPVDLTVSSLKEHVKIKVVPVVESAPNIVIVRREALAEAPERWPRQVSAKKC